MNTSKDIQLLKLDKSMEKDIRKIKKKYYNLKKKIISNKKNGSNWKRDKIEWTIFV